MKPAVIVIAALVTVGCGGSETKTVTEVQSAPTSSGTTATVPDIGGAIPRQKKAPEPTPPASSGSVAQARAVVEQRGYTVDDSSSYHQSDTLRVLVGTRSRGRGQRAFFFVGGRFLGTDTSDDSAGIRVASTEDSLVTLSYQLFRPGDPLCCPTGGKGTVRYRWNGTRLTPLDPIPSSSAGANPSRL